MGNNPTIVDVARQAGVSHATVSMVINNRRAITPATAQRVRQAMVQLNYVPPPLGKRRGPRPRRERQTRGTVALLIINMPTATANPVYMAALRGVDEALSKENRSLHVRHVDVGSGGAVEADFDSSEGLVLLGRAGPEAALAAFGRKPCVWIMGDGFDQCWCDHVGIHERQVTTLAARHLLARGCTCGLYVGRADGFWGERADAFSRTFVQNGGQAAQILLDAAFHAEAGGRGVNPEELLAERLAALDPRPTGLFAGDLLPVVMQRLANLGLEHRRDYEAVTCNVEGLPRHSLRTPVATVDVHPAETGRRAVEQLLWRKVNRNHPRVELLIEPTLIPLTEGAPELGSAIGSGD